MGLPINQLVNVRLRNEGMLQVGDTMFPSSRGLAVRDVPQRNWNRMRQTGFKLFCKLTEKWPNF